MGAASRLNDPNGNEPIGNDPIGNEPIGNDPIGNEPIGNDPNGNDPIGNEPIGKDPIGNEPNGNDDSDSAATGAPLTSRLSSVSLSVQSVNGVSAVLNVVQMGSALVGSALEAHWSSTPTVVSPSDKLGS